MSCPHASSTLRGLPGKDYHPAARRLREAFLEGSIDFDQFAKENCFSFPRTSDARAKNKLQSYALASIIIDDFWKWVDKTHATNVLRQVCVNHYATKSYDERILAFNVCFGVLSDTLRKRYLDELRTSKDAQMLTEVNRIFVCFFGVSRHRWRRVLGGGVRFPSMKDLTTLTIRFARVAPTVFQREYGRAPSREEILALLRQPGLLRFFVEMAANDRPSMYPFFSRLEGKRSNLNDLDRMFDPSCFELHSCDGSDVLRVKPEIIEECRRAHTKAERRRKKRNKADPLVLGCPALYGGKFREMHEWVLDALEPWI